jgi:hypothetical protein
MLSSRNFLAPLLVGFAVLAGCADDPEKEGVGSIDSELTLQAEILGNMVTGDVKTGRYSGAPANRAFTFTAHGTQKVTAEVALEGGDALAFITDANFLVLAENDDAGPGTQNAKVTFTVPAGPVRPLRVVFRDSAAPAATYQVKLTIPCNPAAEPWNTYKGDAAECEVLTWSCGGGETRFKNACGCGCERPN